MNNNLYFVGQQLEEFIGRADGTQFDMTDTGSVLTIVLRNPTNQEVWNVSKLKEIRMTCFPDTLWMTFRFGSLPWMDAPFNPHLSKQADLIRNYRKACSNLTIMLINSADGRILYLGTAEFSDEFSAGLRVGCLLLLSQEFERQEYDSLLNFIMSRYSADQIAGSAAVTYRLS